MFNFIYLTRIRIRAVLFFAHPLKVSENLSARIIKATLLRKFKSKACAEEKIDLKTDQGIVKAKNREMAIY